MAAQAPILVTAAAAAAAFLPIGDHTTSPKSPHQPRAFGPEHTISFGAGGGREAVSGYQGSVPSARRRLRGPQPHMKLRRGAPCRPRTACRRRGTAGLQHEGARPGCTAGNKRAEPQSAPGKRLHGSRRPGGLTPAPALQRVCRQRAVRKTLHGPASLQKLRGSSMSTKRSRRTPKCVWKALPLKPKRVTTWAFPAGSER